MMLFDRRRDGRFSEDAMGRELAHHFEELVEANLAAGMSADEARRQARLEFGGETQMMQELREVHTLAWLDRMRANLRAAMRFIRHSPSFSVAIILTLALGIGANSAVFSAIDAVLLRPLPLLHSEELVELGQDNFKTRNPSHELAPVRLEDWNRMNSTFQAISGYYTEDVSETSGDLPEKLLDATVAPRFLMVWGITPELGRDFAPAEERYGGPPAVLISDRLWRRRFHGDHSAIGKALHFGKHSYTIVGVLPASFHFGDVDVWDPNPSGGPYTLLRQSSWFQTQGRMKPGVTLAEAKADLTKVQQQLGKQFPETDKDLTVEIKPLKEKTIGDSSGSLWLLFGAVSLLLLIACTNITALLLARATEREQEVAIRLSLGASRRVVLSQLLTETFVLALIGSMLGLLVAAGASHFFATFAKDLPRVEEITLNWRIVVYSLGCALVTTLLSGLFPALRATRGALRYSLGRSNRTQVAGRSGLHWMLVGAQIALAIMLLIGAGLLLRSFAAMGRVYPGFESAHVLTLHMSWSWGESVDAKKLAQRINRALDTLRAMPGVEAAATSSFLPGVPVDYQAEFKVAEGAEDPNRKVVADQRYVSTGYFATMKIPMLAGESCRDGLDYGTAVVNRSFAETYFLQGDAIGHHLMLAAGQAGAMTFRVEGIAADAKESGLNHAPEPTMYWCISDPSPDPNFLVRVHGDPQAMAEPIRRTLRKLEPARAVYAMMPLDEHLSDAFAENRLRTILLSLFAATAIALVSIGIYGTISYLGRTRRREIGLRIALGALPRQIVWRFVGQSFRVAAVAGVFGLMLGLGAGRLLKGMLYGVASVDVATYAGGMVLVFVVTAIASTIPAVRAARVEPTQALREE